MANIWHPPHCQVRVTMWFLRKHQRLQTSFGAQKGTRLVSYLLTLSDAICSMSQDISKTILCILGWQVSGAEDPSCKTKHEHGFKALRISDEPRTMVSDRQTAPERSPSLSESTAPPAIIPASDVDLDSRLNRGNLSSHVSAILILPATGNFPAGSQKSRIPLTKLSRIRGRQLHIKME